MSKKKILLIVAIVGFAILGGVITGVIDWFNKNDTEHGQQYPTERSLVQETEEKEDEKNEPSVKLTERFGRDLYEASYVSGVSGVEPQKSNPTVKPEPANPTPKPVPKPVPVPKKPILPKDKMVAGRRTVKNFLMTALAPVGEVLWVTGGGWKLDDAGADEAARSIGLSSTWLDFFASEDADYCTDETDPVDGKNVCHEKGLDADGYVGWVVYNTLFSESLVDEGFVATPDRLVELLSPYCDFESATDLAGKTPAEVMASMKPGDFALMNGRHMYIFVGSCEDGSAVIVHSALGTSSTGAAGGSVQLSSVNEGGTQDCEAYELADGYMSEKCPEWDERYDTLSKSTEVYGNFYNYAVDPEANGVFHWKEGILEDPDGYTDMTADEILEDLYAEEPATEQNVIKSAVVTASNAEESAEELGMGEVATEKVVMEQLDE